MIRLLLIVSDSDESDARAILAHVVHDLDAGAIDSADWLLVESDDDERRKVAQRERQRRSRARRKRDMSQPMSHSERDTIEENSDSIGGVIHSLPALEGQEGVSETPNGHAFVTRDMSRERDAMSQHQLPPMTDAQRDTGRAQSAAIRDAMRNGDL